MHQISSCKTCLIYHLVLHIKSNRRRNLPPRSRCTFTLQVLDMTGPYQMLPIYTLQGYKRAQLEASYAMIFPFSINLVSNQYWPYKHAGWSQKCPCHFSSHTQVFGSSPQPPWTPPGSGAHSSQLSPLHPLLQLHIYKCFWLNRIGHTVLV